MADIKTESIGIWNGLPPIAKAAIVIGAITGAYLIYRNISKNATTNARVKDVKNELNSLIESGITPSLSPVQINMIADGLYKSMDGYNYLTQTDTDLKKFRSNFYQIKNEADLLAVISKFGNKEGADLKTWMSTEWVGNNKLNTTANDHLRSVGIRYRF